MEVENKIIKIPTSNIYQSLNGHTQYSTSSYPFRSEYSYT